jgi:ribosome-associated toxin RatA of RatAB toxin-antitoxin module
MTRSGSRVMLVLLFLMCAACWRDRFDWGQKEDFMLSQSETTLDDRSVRMEFVSLVNAPADPLFLAFSDVEHHAEFVTGVSESRLVSSSGNKKVIDITNQVLGRPNRATIEWTIEPQQRKLSFKTIEALYTDNSAEYVIDPSPDGTRSRVTTIYYLRDKGGHPFPLHLIRMAIRDGYVAAVSSVKRHALGPKAVVEH